MKKFNLIVVFNKDLKNILFCIRAKEPYKGLYNFTLIIQVKLYMFSKYVYFF